MTRTRRGERGLSVIEAIVIATITALLALLLLPLMSSPASGSIAVAERSIDTLDAVRAEREFRALVRAVSPRETSDQPRPLVEGNAAIAVLYPNLQLPVACAAAGAPAVRLQVARDALFCVSAQGRRVLLRWTSDSVGTLAYSGDGVVWRNSWRGDPAAPYVRFELRQRGRLVAAWVERPAGGPP